MPIFKIFLFTPRHKPAPAQLTILDILLGVCKKILKLIFWAQKYWFIELNLSLCSDMECMIIDGPPGSQPWLQRIFRMYVVQ